MSNLALIIDKVNEQAAEAEKHRFTHQFYRKPYLDAAAINKTITQNYHAAIKKYADYCQERNQYVISYNDIMKDKEEEKERNTPLLRLLFKKTCRIKKIAITNVDNPEEYNQEIIQFNQDNGTHFLMKKWQPIKMGTDPVFAVMVKYYAAQLRDFLKSKEANTANGIVILPQLRTNSWKIANYKIDGVDQVFLSGETIRRQIKRLDAAGIIQHFNRGADSDFGAYFNPEILDIQYRLKADKTDKETENGVENPKSQNAENQIAKGSKTTKCRVWDYSLPEHNEKTQKEKQFTTALRRNEPNGSTVKTRNLNQNTQSEKNPARKTIAGNVKTVQLPDFLATAQNKGVINLDQPHDQTSVGLCQAIETDHILAADLAGHAYDSYQPIDNKLLEWESLHGTMSNEEYLILIAQVFTKQFAQLYIDIDKYYEMRPWQWFNFLEKLQTAEFRTFTGRAFTKESIFKKYSIMKRMLKRAISSFSRKGNKNYPGFPSDYILRSHPVSFWNLQKRVEESDRQALARKAKNAPNNKKFKKQEVKIERKRSTKRRVNDHKKAMKAIRSYLRNEHVPGSYEKLYHYVKDNLLVSFSKDLGLLIEKERKAL